MLKIFLFLFLFINFNRGQCPYKHGSGGHLNEHEKFDDSVHQHHQQHQQQGLNDENDNNDDEKNYIQTTFIHRDIEDDDLKYTQDVIHVINIIRQQLKTKAKITIDNENADCNDNGFPQCEEYPLKETYHFLIVEDSSKGASVYSLEKEFNTNVGKIEAAILDALSRHSPFALTSYTSKDAEKEVGFVRELTSKELNNFMKQNKHNKKDTVKSSLIIRSPTELNLINPNILELRDIDIPKTDDNDLIQFTGEKLNNLLETVTNKYIFVLFWTKVNSISIHSFYLWLKTATILKNNQNIILGSVACHEEIDICKAFAISHQDKNTILVYQNGKKITAQFNMRDVDFYVEWINMVSSGIVKKLTSEDETKQARQGFLDYLPDLNGEKRTAITIGCFNSDEDNEDFKQFETIAKILNGRYHFVYYIDENKKSSTLTTFRPFEKTRRIDFNGKFDISSLVKHVTTASNPSVYNLSYGFTSDLIYYQSRDLILLIHDNDQDLFAEFISIASKSENNAKFIFGFIDTSKSLDITNLLSVLNSNKDEIPMICYIEENRMSCKQKINKISKDILSSDYYKDGLIHLMCPKKPHPLKYLQLEHINKIFGSQEIRLLPEPRTIKSYQNIPNHHGLAFDKSHDNSESFGGCPFMQQMNDGHLRDEL